MNLYGLHIAFIIHRTFDKCICCTKSIVDEELIENVYKVSWCDLYLFVGGPKTFAHQ